MLHKESEHQRLVISWARLQQNRYPCLKWLHSSLNAGRRTKIQSAIAKAEGLTAGIADLFLPYKSNGYSGLYIEMKYGKNKPTPQQKDFLEYATSQGFKCVVCYDWVSAKDIIMKYIN